MLQELPNDSKIQIILFLDIKSIIQLSETSKENLQLIQNEERIWNFFCSFVFLEKGETPSLNIYKKNLEKGFLNEKTFIFTGEKSKFSFILGLNDGWKPPSSTVHLAYEGKEFFDLGQNMDTISAWYERKGEFQEIKNTLNYPKLTMEDDFILKIGEYLPRGSYNVASYIQKPVFVKANSTLDYFTNDEKITQFLWKIEDHKEDHYRIFLPSNEKIDKYDPLHFLYPLQVQLNEKTVLEYEMLLDEGFIPSVLCLSFCFPHNTMDFAYSGYNLEAECYGDVTMISFILDGHHKLRAAANKNKNLRFLNYTFHQKFNLEHESYRTRTSDPIKFLKLLCKEKIKSEGLIVEDDTKIVENDVKKNYKIYAENQMKFAMDQMNKNQSVKEKKKNLTSNPFDTLEDEE